MNKCKDCSLNKTAGCIGFQKRKILVEDYDTDCWMSEEDKILCDMMCGYDEESLIFMRAMEGMRRNEES